MAWRQGRGESAPGPARAAHMRGLLGGGCWHGLPHSGRPEPGYGGWLRLLRHQCGRRPSHEYRHRLSKTERIPAQFNRCDRGAGHPPDHRRRPGRGRGYPAREPAWENPGEWRNHRFGRCHQVAATAVAVGHRARGSVAGPGYSRAQGCAKGGPGFAEPCLLSPAIHHQGRPDGLAASEPMERGQGRRDLRASGQRSPDGKLCAGGRLFPHRPWPGDARCPGRPAISTGAGFDHGQPLSPARSVAQGAWFRPDHLPRHAQQPWRGELALARSHGGTEHRTGLFHRSPGHAGSVIRGGGHARDDASAGNRETC